ncbi:MAG: LysR family transcriptional regulator [Myxococcales bacterium]
MDWRSIGFEWAHARAFLVTAEEGSLSAAAVALGLTQPTVGRQVAALSEQLGVVLFERVGRGLELTPAGAELLQHVREMADAAQRFSLAAAGKSQSLSGSVCISASELHAVHLLPPAVAALRAAYPAIEVEVLADNAASDLRRRQADIAVRNFRPREPDLVARKLREAPAYLYASEDYLRRLGHPSCAAELTPEATFIGFDAGVGLRLALQGAMGLSLRPEQFAVRSESQLVQWELIKRGVGIGIMIPEVGDAEPGVRRLWPSLPPIVFPMWLVAHRELRDSRRVRVVFELLAEHLGGAG